MATARSSEVESVMDRSRLFACLIRSVVIERIIGRRYVLLWERRAVESVRDLQTDVLPLPPRQNCRVPPNHSRKPWIRTPERSESRSRE
jgi:hypothetical protein